MPGAIRFVVPVELPGSESQKFSLAVPFFAAGEFFEIPLGRFAAEAVAWAAKLNAAGNATWSVEVADIEGAYMDMVGAGTDPAIAADDDLLVEITDWDLTELPADPVLRVTCLTLSGAQQATFTLHFERV